MNVRTSWVAVIGSILMECAQTFLGVFPGFLREWQLREEISPQGNHVYFFPIDAGVSAGDVQGLLMRVLGNFFQNEGVQLLVLDENAIGFQLNDHQGEACAHLDLRESGWEFFVPSNLFSGDSYEAMEAKWVSFANALFRVCLEKFP